MHSYPSEYSGINVANTAQRESIIFKNTGYISQLTNLTKLITIDLGGCNALSGNFEIMYINMSKLTYVNNQMYYYSSTDRAPNNWSSNKIFYGDISVFGDKYDLELLGFAWRNHISGELKSLKNLKKLYYLALDSSMCTGSKTDLYNGGANVSHFAIQFR